VTANGRTVTRDHRATESGFEKTPLLDRRQLVDGSAELCSQCNFKPTDWASVDRRSWDMEAICGSQVPLPVIIAVPGGDPAEALPSRIPTLSRPLRLWDVPGPVR
jgi:hypothetical protein